MAPYEKSEKQVDVPAQDHWGQTRNERMRCHTCAFFVLKSDALTPTTSVAGSLGRCRKHSPVVGQGWPAVFEQDWCGDHKLL